MEPAPRRRGHLAGRAPRRPRADLDEARPRRGDVFGNALSQSGAFWYSPGALEIESPFGLEPGALMREIVAAPAQPVRVWMEVGLFEGAAPLNGGNQIAQTRHLRDVLLAKGYRVSYHEYAGGHDWESWRGSLADGLIELVVLAG